jgi:hypothetical protein
VPAAVSMGPLEFLQRRCRRCGFSRR